MAKKHTLTKKTTKLDELMNKIKNKWLLFKRKTSESIIVRLILNIDLEFLFVSALLYYLNPKFAIWLYIIGGFGIYYTYKIVVGDISHWVNLRK